MHNTAAVVRLHPAGSLVPAALAGLLMALFVLASVSTGVVQLPQQSLPGELFSIGSDPTAVGTPALAHPARHGAPASGSHAANGGVSAGHPGSGQGTAAQSLVASSTKVPKPHGRLRNRGRSAQRRDCGPAIVRAHGTAGPGGQDAVLAGGTAGTGGTALPCGPGS